MRMAWMLVLSGLVFSLLPSVASASSPALLGVGSKQLHPTATFSSPGADSVEIYFSTSPDRATDGSFLTEHVATLDSFTDDEIATGSWLDEDQLDPGLYYAMLLASSFSCPDGIDCADGYSNVLALRIPKPKQRYHVKVTPGFIAGFELKITPAGEDVPYRLCWRRTRRARRCERGTVNGFDWNESASDVIFLTPDDLKLPRGQTKTTVTWYIDKRRIASRRVRID